MDSDRRKHPRISANNPVAYKILGHGNEVVGHGMLIDLTEGGCQIHGSTAVNCGDRIELILYGEGDEPTTVLNACRVTWTQDLLFGMQFEW